VIPRRAVDERVRLGGVRAEARNLVVDGDRDERRDGAASRSEQSTSVNASTNAVSV